MIQPLLVTDGLKVSLVAQGRTLVNGISLAIDRGDWTMLVGRSGSGKSLTLRAIMGLLSARTYEVTGDVQFDGKVLLQPARDRVCSASQVGIAMIFQDPSAHLNPLMTIGAHLQEVLDLAPGQFVPQSERVCELLRKVRLPNPERIARSYPHQLSGGQKQRAMIALALATHPKLLLADEPTSSLDATIQRELVELIDELRRTEGLSILMVTHDMALAFSVADRIHVIEDGAIVDSFAPRQFDPGRACPATAALMAAPAPLHDATSRVDKADLVLVAHSLTKSYSDGAVRALAPISFAIARGSIVAIVGESGSGKTTLGRLLVGLLKPSGGHVQIDRREGGKHHQARVVQMIFQDPATALDPDRTVAALLIETMRVNGIAESVGERSELAIRLLRRVGLSAAVLGMCPRQLSGGERQRVAIARALSVQPEVLICDESVSALDAHLQGEVLALLAELRRDMALSILFITHNLDLVGHFADEIIVLHDGLLVEAGAVEDILRQPQSDYTRKLLAARYHLPGRM